MTARTALAAVVEACIVKDVFGLELVLLQVNLLQKKISKNRSTVSLVERENMETNCGGA